MAYLLGIDVATTEVKAPLIREGEWAARAARESPPTPLAPFGRNRIPPIGRRAPITAQYAAQIGADRMLLMLCCVSG